MRIVSPYDNLASAEAPIKMGRERIKRFRHMPITQVPGVHAALEHPAVVFFGVSNQSGILLRGKEVVLCDLTVPVQVFIGVSLNVRELLHDLVFARLRQIKSRCIAVFPLVLAEMIETRVTITRSAGCVGIYLFQVSNDFRSRTIQAVKIESI